MSMKSKALLVLFAASMSQDALADTEACIGSTTALYQAFAAVNGGSTGTILFKLQSGTYTLGAPLTMGYRAEDGDPNRAHGTLTIRGGYNGDCTSNSAALGATTFVAGSGTPAITIELNNNSLVIESISAQNVDLAISNWICYTHHYGEGNQVTIRQSRFESTRVTQSSNCHSTSIRNSMITSRSDNPNDQAIIVSPYADETLSTPSFTMVGSTVRSGALRIAVQSDTSDPPKPMVKLQNSVFENDGAEVSIDGADVYAIRNRYDSLAISNGQLQQNSNNIAAAPQLTANGRPSTTSPLVNAGSRFVDGGLPVVDLAANPRLIGTDPDIGAFETNVNNALYLDVTTTASSGAGSLAQAVASANAFDGGQVIRFDLSGACPRVITLTSRLNISDDLRILGDTQPGTVPNTLVGGVYNGAPCVVLQAGAGVTDAIDFESADPADNLQVTNLGFSGFSGAGVTVRSGQGHRLTGLHFGAPIGALSLNDVSFAIRVVDAAGNANIGGTEPELANLIGNSSIAIQLSGIGSNQVIGNAIGSRGLDDLGNNLGISVTSPLNLISDNRIVLSSSPNLLITGTDAIQNTVTNNSISAGDNHGIVISSGANRNRIGPDNSIIGNGLDGISIGSGALNQIRENRFGSNGGLGIDLAPDGVTVNDIDPATSIITGLANRLQNYPVLTSVRRSPLFGQFFAVLDGELETTAGTYAIDIFRVASCDASGHGEGNVLIGSTTVTVDCGQFSNCAEPFEVLLADDGFDDGQHIALTATGPGGNTSEFSPCYDQNPDYNITVSNGMNGAQAGRATTYTITATNDGYTTVGNERIRDTFPAACANVIWTCLGSNGGTCSSSGFGNINDSLVSLPIGASVTYTATCYLAANATGSLVNTATVTSGRDDLTPADNTDTDSDPIVRVQLSVGQASVVEGTGGVTQLAYTVTATPTPLVDTTVDFATSNGTATAGGDYSAVSGTLTFAAGTASRIVRVNVLTDDEPEADETLTLTLSDPGGAEIVVASATGTILNDDALGTTTSISSHAPNPSEVGEPYTVTVLVRSATQAPAGTAEVGDGLAHCTAVLTAVTAAASRGSCVLSSVLPGNRTLTATYQPSNTSFAGSAASAIHQVTMPVLLSDGFED